MENKIIGLSSRTICAYTAMKRRDADGKYFSPETYELLNALEEQLPGLKPAPKPKFRVGQIVQFLDPIKRPVKIAKLLGWAKAFYRYEGTDGMIYREDEFSSYTVEDIS